jgi:hypothetical protein
MVNIKYIRVTNMFISMLLTYSYNMGARCRFGSVRAIRQKQSSSRIKLIKWLFYRFILNQAQCSRIFRWELIRGPSLVSHARRLSCERSHPRLMKTHPSVAGIEHYQRSRRPYATCTCLSSFFESSLV